MSAIESGPSAALGEEPLDNEFPWAAQHARDYVASGGEGHDRTPDGIPVLLLTTVGRRTGRARRNPLVYGRRGEDYVLIAAKGGAPQDPAWFSNLVAEPQVLLQIRDQQIRATARVPEGEEHDELYALMLDVLPALSEYQDKTERSIPVVVVTPHS